MSWGRAAAAAELPRQLLAELGADVAAGLPVVEADLPESKAIADRYAEAYSIPTA